MSNEPIHIIIVEDDHILRESLIEYLALVGYHVTGAGSGRDFYRALDANSYSIAIIDIGLPDQSGLVLAEYIHANTTMGIIILTAVDGEDDQHRGYEAGADLYLTKPVSSRVLASAIAKLASRLTPLKDSVRLEKDTLDWILDQTSWMLISPQNIPIALTAMELEFLKELAKSSGSATNRNLLIQRLYPNRSDNYSSRAIDALVRRLREKISRVPNCTNPIKSAYGIGFCFTEPLSVR